MKVEANILTRLELARHCLRRHNLEITNKSLATTYFKSSVKLIIEDIKDIDRSGSCEEILNKFLEC